MPVKNTNYTERKQKHLYKKEKYFNLVYVDNQHFYHNNTISHLTNYLHKECLGKNTRVGYSEFILSPCSMIFFL